MAINRVVQPELLDTLPAGDPHALRSRRDLRLINSFMGNFRWVNRMAARFYPACREGIVEIGAGEGCLCARLQRTFPDIPVTGVDFAPRPEGLPASAKWRRGDLFDELSSMPGGFLTGVMIAHHFIEGDLRRLGERARAYQVVALCEPYRSRVGLTLGMLGSPAFGKVTQHDLPVSVRAGFRKGELAHLLELAHWNIEEHIDWRGALRFVAWQR